MSSKDSTAEEVFDAIQSKAYSTGAGNGDYPSFSSWLNETFEQARQTYPSMKDKTVMDYLMYHQTRRYEDFKAKNAGPAPTAQQFWSAAWEYDPLGQLTGRQSTLEVLINSNRLGPIIIGKVYGEKTLRLLPAIGALPAQKLNFTPPFQFAATDSCAISYPDGHPTEQLISPSTPSASASASRPTDISEYLIKPSNDHILRRIAALGWVAMQDSRGDWIRTGHVLVIDMDERSVRHRQPWLVLASEWPTESEQTPEDEFTIRAEEIVDRDDSSEPGVFPGDRNRTPVCRIEPAVPSTINVLQRLGEGFNFNPARLSGNHSAILKDLGPAIPRVMNWYWDPQAEQEVCYNNDGTEYMRYDRKGKGYLYPGFSNKSVVGQQSMFGELVEGPPLPPKRRGREHSTKEF
ncbi:MAG: hypothetical protein Q9184_005881 [Pyrenodesmia sp. 2 TL-2023]